MTTSSFSPSARETAEFLSKRIVLIDGEQLTKLMIRYNVGCRVEESLDIRKIDEEFLSRYSASGPLLIDLTWYANVYPNPTWPRRQPAFSF